MNAPARHRGARTSFEPARPARFRRPSRRPAFDPSVIAVALAAVLLLATRQAFTVPYTGLGLSPAQLILFVLLLLWAATRITGQRKPTRLGVLSGLILVRLCLLLISYGLAAGRVLSADQRTASDQTLAFEVAAAGTVILLVTVLRSWRDLELVVRALVIGAAASGAFALVQYGTGLDLAAKVKLPGLRDTGDLSAVELVRLGVVRSQGAAGVPLELGAVMTAVLPLGLGLTFLARRRGQRWWGWALASLLMAGGAVVSLSRVVFVATAVALLVMMLRWPIRRTLAVLGGLVVLVGVALASGSQVIDAVRTVLTSGSNDYSLTSRSNGRSYVWMHFAEHFWFGQGPGTYDLTVQPVLDNQYLSQLVEDGTLGLILFVAVLLTALAYALRATARRVTPEAAELPVAIAGAMTTIVVSSSVLDTAGFVQIFSLTWLLIGLCAVSWRLNVRDVRAVAPAAAGVR